ncbi:MAG TPA: hypothetical protein VN279_13685 [Rhodocyclaceae bacterium]|jgi:hypothetical protein|nr:hypothetical protein [Rhodocyclaceae bacterium]
MKPLYKALLLCVPVIAGSLVAVPQVAEARKDRYERWDERRDKRRAYVAGAVAAHRGEKWRERREYYERRERRQDAAAAVIGVAVGAAIGAAIASDR